MKLLRLETALQSIATMPPHHLGETRNEYLMRKIATDALEAKPPPPALQWQPIDSAPKDGTAILGWDGREMVTVRWCEYGYWDICEAGHYAEDTEWTPTHWMPLPDPPTSEGVTS